MKLGYVLLYVDNVEETMSFYQEAFGLKKGFIDPTKQYGEMLSGDAKLGFVQHETASSHGFEYEKMNISKKPPAFEIGFVIDDVTSAYEKAIKAGATSVSVPKTKPWGQKVSYVKDCNGFLVEICSPMGN